MQPVEGSEDDSYDRLAGREGREDRGKDGGGNGRATKDVLNVDF
jgi:hypothetical protein